MSCGLMPTQSTSCYLVSNYPVSVRLVEPCDPSWEKTSEFDVTQWINTAEGSELRRQWHWEPSNNFFGDSQYVRLEGSQIAAELTIDDSPVEFSFRFVETDPIENEVSLAQLRLSAYDETDEVEREINQSCHLKIRYDREVTLVRKLPGSGQDHVFSRT